MPANDEFPRGWEYSTGVVTPANVPSIVVPAAPGLSHVLTAINTSDAIQTGGSSNIFDVEVQFGGNTIVLGLLAVPGSTANEQYGFTWTGKIVTRAGDSLTVLWTLAVGAANLGILEIQGYDI